jgi:site-specific DNA recombinase
VSGVRVATYSRISTDEEHQPFSLGAQGERLEAYVKSQDGWRIVRSYEDQISGSTLERRGLQKALADARAGAFDLLVVVRVDRLARSVRGLAQLLAELDEAGVAFRSATEPFETATPAGRMMVQMLGVFAEFERAMIIERVVAGMEKKARNGGWVPGRPPIGYRVASKDGLLEAVEPQASLVRKIFALYIEQRLGTRALANLLNEQGERTERGKLWSGTSIQDVLENPVYIGEIRWRGEQIPGMHEPLVSRELFEQAQTLLKERGAQRSKRRGNASDYLLSGVTRCGWCGSAMVGSAANGRNGRYRYYTCLRRHRQGKQKGCRCELIPADQLEQQLLAVLASSLADSGLLDKALARASELAAGRQPVLQAEAERIEARQRDLERTRDRYLEAFERGTLPEDACGQRLRAISDELDQLTAREAELQPQLAQAAPARLDPKVLDRALHALTDGLPGIQPSQRKHLIQQFVASIEIRDRDWIQPTLRLPTVRIVTGSVERTGIEPVTSGLQTRGHFAQPCVLAGVRSTLRSTGREKV